jgi:hypothetical protein
MVAAVQPTMPAIEQGSSIPSELRGQGSLVVAWSRQRFATHVPCVEEALLLSLRPASGCRPLDLDGKAHDRGPGAAAAFRKSFARFLGNVPYGDYGDRRKREASLRPADPQCRFPNLAAAVRLAAIGLAVASEGPLDPVAIAICYEDALSVTDDGSAASSGACQSAPSRSD